MEEIDQIKQPVSKAFEQFEKIFAQALFSEEKSICSAIDAVYRSSGKHVRPLLLLLSASACGNISPRAIQSAVLLELLHTASLIHDDVVDDTRQRRGTPSLNNVRGNAVAVLVGDFILSTVIIRALETVDKQIVKIIAKLSRSMVEGEIKQLDNTGEMILSENEYLAVLEKKTAGLLSSCTEIGAITADAPYELQVRCRMFGSLMGLCFQIKDDIFDYFDNADTGKPSGNDIRDGKVTLPLLYALESSSAEEKEPYMQMLREKRFTPKNIASLIRFAKNKGGIEYAEGRMREYKSKAVEIMSTLADSDAKNSLLRLADYIVERTK
jgi:octaprenyl-diphosphate synthase